MKLVHYNRSKPRTCFGHPFVAIYSEVVFDGYITNATKPIYSYKILSFMYVIHIVCVFVLTHF